MVGSGVVCGPPGAGVGTGTAGQWCYLTDQGEEPPGDVDVVVNRLWAGQVEFAVEFHQRPFDADVVVIAAPVGSADVRGLKAGDLAPAQTGEGQMSTSPG